jgi:hypothetical protein
MLKEAMDNQGGSAGKLIKDKGRREIKRRVALSASWEVVKVCAHELSLEPDSVFWRGQLSGAMSKIEKLELRPVADSENTAPGRVMTSGAAIK